jgi:hypothetical protein
MNFQQLAASCLLLACSALALVLVQNCTDTVSCDASTCTAVMSAPDGQCVELPADSYIIPAPYGRLECSPSPSLCSPTMVFFNDSKCLHPQESYWTPCGVCLQYPSRRQTCKVINDTFVVHVETCNDPSCRDCVPNKDPGLAPGVCYAHPDVPGLYLEYPNLEACTNIVITGYNDSLCAGPVQAQTVMPGRSKCFGGLSFACQP